MAFRLINNRRGGTVHVLITSNSSLTIAGNSSVSDIATGNEVVAGCSVLRAWCGSSSGNGAYWTVKRGANTIAVLDSTAFIDYAGNGVSINLDSNATLVANIQGADLTGSLILELKKIGANGESGPMLLSDNPY